MNDNNSIRDEYQSYTLPIFNLKIAGESVEMIALKLYEIETENMGLVNGCERCKKAAEKIFALVED